MSGEAKYFHRLRTYVEGLRPSRSPAEIEHREAFEWRLRVTAVHLIGYGV